jgi:hypothetical protein
VKKVLRWVGIFAAAIAFAFAFRNVDLGKAVAAVAGIGPAAPLVLVPALAALCLDACAWRALLALLGHDVPIARIVRARISAEAIALTMPGGALAAESIKPELLRDAGVPLRDGIAAVAARKVGVLATNGVWVFAALVLGFPHLPKTIAIGLGVTALVLGGLSAGLWTAGRKLGARSLDRVRLLFGTMRSRWLAIASPLLAAWVLEAVESFVVLRLLGVDASFSFVVAMEASVSVLRNVVVVAPAGLGVQDAGYAAWLAHIDVMDPASTAAAFVVVKRAKDATIACMGYGLLALRTAHLVAATARTRTSSSSG